MNKARDGGGGKWTPGPWRVTEGPGHAPDCCDLTICGDIFMLAHIRGPNYAHCESNARLIAAAPAMAEALRAILFQVVQGPVLERDACVTQARAALALAERGWGMKIGRYLAIVIWAKRRYTKDGFLTVKVGGNPSRYTQIENLAWNRYMFNGEPT